MVLHLANWLQLKMDLRLPCIDVLLHPDLSFCAIDHILS